MKVIWSHRAKRDLQGLVVTIAEESLQRADLVSGRILRSAQLLYRTPRAGRPGRVAGTRERVVGRTPYILAYKILSARVKILRVYHGARRWPAEF
jgi:plasmid stabilization system protein ParE